MFDMTDIIGKGRDVNFRKTSPEVHTIESKHFRLLVIVGSKCKRGACFPSIQLECTMVNLIDIIGKCKRTNPFPSL